MRPPQFAAASCSFMLLVPSRAPCFVFRLGRRGCKAKCMESADRPQRTIQHCQTMSDRLAMTAFEQMFQAIKQVSQVLDTPQFQHSLPSRPQLQHRLLLRRQLQQQPSASVRHDPKKRCSSMLGLKASQESTALRHGCHKERSPGLSTLTLRSQVALCFNDCDVPAVVSQQVIGFAREERRLRQGLFRKDLQLALAAEVDEKKIQHHTHLRLIALESHKGPTIQEW